MPAVGGATLTGRLAALWRSWTAVWAKYLGSWTEADFVYVFESGDWRLIWATSTATPQSPLAVLDISNSVDVLWDRPDPEAVQVYEVRRSDGSLVGTVTADGSASYSLLDTAPLGGSNAYTIVATAPGLPSSQAVTNAVDVDLSPASATVTFDSDPAPDRSATIAWTGEEPGTTSVSVYRPNSSLVATVAAGVGTVTDLSPRAEVDDGRYLVVAANGSGPAGSVETNAVDIALVPPSASLSSVGPIDYTAGVTIDWSSAVGEHTGFRVSHTRSCDGLSYDINAPVAEGASSTVFGPTSNNAGGESEIVVRSQINARESAPAAAGTVAWNPGPPSSVAAVPTGTLGRLTLSWAAPSYGCVSGYEVEYDDGGWTGSSDDTSPSSHTFSGSSGSRSMRVRSLGAGGGVSAWVTVSATPTWDLTPPALPTVTSLKPESSYGRLVYRFTTASSDNHQYRYRRRTNNGAWTTGSWTNVGNSQSVAIVLGTFSSGNDVDVEVQVRDVWLNTSAWSSSWRYKLKPATQDILVSDLNHYREGDWNYAGNGYAYQGYFSSSSSQYYGIILFASSIPAACDADGTVGGKINVTSMQLRGLRRTFPGGGDPGIGNFEVSIYLGTTAKASATGSYGAGDISNVVNFGKVNNQGQLYYFTLSTAQRNAMRDGDRSMGLERQSTEYLAVAACDRMRITSLG